MLPAGARGHQCCELTQRFHIESARVCCNYMPKIRVLNTKITAYKWVYNQFKNSAKAH